MVEGSKCCTFGPQINVHKAVPSDRSAWPSDLQTQVPPAELSFCRAGRGDWYRPSSVERLTIPRLRPPQGAVNVDRRPMGR